MKEIELQKGDIIFFKNHYKDEKGAVTHTYFDHVGMFAGYDAAGLPLIIHSVSSENPYYKADALSGLCLSTLKALKNQVQKEEGYPDVCFDVSFHVVRYNNTALAENALAILENQAGYRIPYDEDRLKIILTTEETLSDEDFKILSEQRYREEGRYRALKFAARHPFPFARVRTNGFGRGLTCIMAVILAYQIAELLGTGWVKSIGEEAGLWVSDKYGPVINDGLAANYRTYLNKIRKTHSRSDDSTVLSHAQWSGSTKIDDFTHSTFAVDAKLTSVAGMWLHLQEKSPWIMMGELDVCERTFSAEERAHKRCERTESFVKIMDELEKATTGRPSLCSSRLSASPFHSPASSSTHGSPPWLHAAKLAAAEIPFFSLTPPAAGGSTETALTAAPAQAGAGGC
jgi:hypothetical protein